MVVARPVGAVLHTGPVTPSHPRRGAAYERRPARRGDDEALAAAVAAPAATRTWASERSPALGQVLGTFRRGGGDPTCEMGAGGLVRAFHTPHGPVTLELRSRPALGHIEAQAWGPGREWALATLPSLLGDDDDVEGFVPRHDLVAQSWRRHPHWRVPRSGLVLDALVPAVIEQKVTGQEAFGGFRRLVRAYGAPAPGPHAAGGLRVPPTVAQWAAVPSWEWLRASVDPARSRTIMAALRVAGRLEQASCLPPEQARARLRLVPGIGVWTAAEVAQRALGDPDAVSFGDYHVAKNIGWALLGHEVDDDGLAEILAPYTGHRYRVQRLLELAGAFRPRRGPRMGPRTHLPR